MDPGESTHRAGAGNAVQGIEMAGSLASQPSAPALPGTLFSENSTRNVVAEGDRSLYRDLLRKAHGNEELAGQWLAQISTTAPTGIPAYFGETVPADLENAAVEAGAPNTFFCPISFKIFRDPVMLPTGHTYERQYIQQWLDQGNTTCPITQEPLACPVQLTPNVALRHAIEDWAERNAIWLLGPNGKVKPIPDDEQFAGQVLAPANALPNCLPAADPPADDVALAIQLQEEELLRHSRPRHQARQLPDNNRAHHLGRPGTPHFPAVQLPLYVLSGLNIAVYVYALYRNNWDITDLQSNPMVGPPTSVFRQIGSRSTPPMVDDGQYWRLITSIFMAPGAIVLFCVLSMMWTLGSMTEKFLVLPILTLPLIYVAAGAIGALWSANLSVALDSCGATAAVCGILGAVWADQIVNWRKYIMHVATLSVLLLITALFGFLGILPLMDNFFHLGSFVAGGLMCCILTLPDWAGPRAAPNGNKKWRACWGLWQTVCLCLLAALIVLPLLGLLLGHAQYGASCSWCKSVACVSTQWWTCSPKPVLAGQPSCTFNDLGNSTARIDCPGGTSHTTPTTGTLDNTALISLCSSLCSVVIGPGSPAGPPAPAAYNPNLGVLI